MRRIISQFIALFRKKKNREVYEGDRPLLVIRCAQVIPQTELKYAPCHNLTSEEYWKFLTYSMEGLYSARKQWRENVDAILLEYNKKNQTNYEWCYLTDETENLFQ